MSLDLTPVIVRRLCTDDLPAALSIQAETYPAFLREGHEAFASRLAVVTPYCLAAVRNRRLLGYLLAHRWPAASPPSVGEILDPDIAGDVVYIHDLAVSRAEKGLGLGRRLVDRALQLAASDGIGSAELIAVKGATSYWRTLGFEEGDPGPAIAAKVASYGPEARWMTSTVRR